MTSVHTSSRCQNLQLYLVLLICICTLDGYVIRSAKKRFKLKYVAASINDNSLSVKLLSSIKDIAREKWNALVSPEYSPFIEWDWINALESSDCASVNEGWQPLHILVYTNSGLNKDDSVLIAAMPVYIKYHSYGEFIFDQSWADYAQRVLGIKYYPKV